MCRAEVKQGLLGDREASPGFCGQEGDGDEGGVGGEDVGCWGQRDGNTGGFVGEMGVVALSVRKGGEL